MTFYASRDNNVGLVPNKGVAINAMVRYIMTFGCLDIYSRVFKFVFMLAKPIIFIMVFALTFALHYFFATDKDIASMVFVSGVVALIGALTSDLMLRVVVKGVKKIVKPKPN